MHVSDFTYKLPKKLIAQYPPKERGTTRLLVLDRTARTINHRKYKDLVDYIRPGDVVVLNNTKVIKARLFAQNSQGEKRELLLIEDHNNSDPISRRALYRGKLRLNEKLKVGNADIVIEKIYQAGSVDIRSNINLLDLADKSGSVPLPPYINRKSNKNDTQRYQTMFATKIGSVAAPTASLNFTYELKEQLEAVGAVVVYLTLHVGLGTFLPIRTEIIENHKMHSEYFEINKVAVEIIIKAKQNNNKIVAIGTTVARTLEFAATEILNHKPKNLSGEADIFIYPGYKFRLVDALLTNFHAPKSTVLMLTAAFAGWDNLKNAYEEAIEEKYAFLSYGDSMLII